MAGSIKGIIVEIGGDTSGLEKALKKVNTSTASLSKELRGVNSLLKLDPKNTELVSQKQKILKDNIEQTAQKLESLRKAQELADETIANGGEISQENYRNLQREIINTENKLKALKLEASKWTTEGRSIEEFGNKINNISSKIDKMGTTLTTRLTLPVVAFGTYAVKSFNEVDEGADTVIKKTGAIGQTAKDLEKVYKTVSSNVVGDFNDIGSAVGEINTRFGFTGDALEKASEKFLKFAKINDTDVNTAVQKISRYMGDASIESSKYSEVLDQLSAVAQASGISIDSLTEMLTKYGAPMRALGLETKESIAIFAGWEKAGVNTEIAFSGMKKAIGTWGKEGKNSTEEFKKTLEEIKRCPDIASATTKAIEVFGQKAGPDLADAIKGGRFEYSQFLDIVKKSEETLENTYDGVVDEADQAQLAIKELKVQLSEMGEEALKTVVPAFKSLLSSGKNLISNYNKLSDSEKKQINNLILLVASIGPATKIMGTLGKTVGTATKGIGIFTQAMGVMKSGANSGVSSVDNLAKVLSGLTSPTGLAVMGIGALTTAIIYFALQETEAQKQHREFAEEMADSKKSLEEYNKSIDETTNSNLAQINSVSNLKDELKTLVDENGKVKDGYKSRVDFILNELNNALGTEYELNGNLIQNYKDLQNEIDTTIEKKKAQLTLEGEEKKAQEAIDNQTQAVEDLKKAEEELLKLQEEYGMSLEELKAKAQEYYSKADSIVTGKGFAGKMWKKNADSIQNVINAYDDAEERVKIYTEQTKKYADLYEKYTEGKYQEVANTIIVTTEDWTSKTLEELNNSIYEQGNSLNIYKSIYERTGNEIALLQMQQAKTNLENLTNELISRTSTINELGQTEIDAWKNLAQYSYEQYSIGISQMAPEMQAKIQEATGVIAGGTPQMQAQAEELGRKTVEEFDKSADAKQKALNVISSYLQGLTNEEKRELLKQAGIENADAVLNELDKGDISEQNGRNILEGLWKGLKNNTWQGKILGVASGLAQSVNKAFTGKSGWDEHSPSKKMKKFAEYYVQPISDVMKSRQRGIISDAQSLANKINSVFGNQIDIPQIKDLGELQGNLNSHIQGNTSNTNNITVQFYPQQMTEAELDRAFNYINKKFGTLY